MKRGLKVSWTPVFRRLALGMLLISFCGVMSLLVSCGSDVRYQRCIPGQTDCGDDIHGRNLECTCEQICRAACSKDKPCIAEEKCIEGFCVHKDEADIRLGRPCDTDSSNSDCKKGRITCVGKQLKCTPWVKAEDELCDGKDNDCDGKIDEELEKRCQNTCGFGVQICKNGVWEDCNAFTTRSCKTSDKTCKEGTELCEKGAWSGICKGELVESEEICDGKDNNCDGQVDEFWPKKGQSCSVGKGGCRDTGVFLCGGPNKKSLICSATEGSSSPEVCDSVDNDCDGKVDNLEPKTCQNACGNGKRYCVGGTWTDCDARAFRMCGSAKGECATGLQRCEKGVWGTECLGRTDGKKEVCDGLDNDCDGKTDEDWPNIGKACVAGSGGCKVTSVWRCDQTGQNLECPAKARTASKEVCDGVDNDCNGKVDDGLTRDCQNACGKGKEYCSGGTWIRCDAASTRLCGSKIGSCRQGVQLCAQATWQACKFDTKPTKEVCDGADNDCDGLVDEDWKTLGDKCVVGNGLCKVEGKFVCDKGGQKVACSESKPKPPSPEICDGKDNDCNGKVDDLKPFTLTKHTAKVKTLDYRSNLALVSGDESGKILVWNVSKLPPTVTRTLTTGGVVRKVLFHPAKTHQIAAAVGNDVQIWDINKGTLLQTFKGHTGIVNDIDFVPNGHVLASGSADKTIKLWLMSTGKVVQTLKGHGDAVLSISFGYFGQILASSSRDRTGRVWSLVNGKTQTFKTGTLIHALDFDYSQNWLTAGSSTGEILYFTIIQLDLFGIRIAQVLPSSGTNRQNGAVLDLFNDDVYASLRVSASTDGKVRVWFGGTLMRTFTGHTAQVNAVTITKRTRNVISASDDKTIRIWRCVRSTP